MSIFRLMRLVHETPDNVTREISLNISERAHQRERIRAASVIDYSSTHGPSGRVRMLMPDSRHRSPTVVDLGTFFMEFWNMKQRGELVIDEPAATWAILLRAIEPYAAIRILLANCVGSLKYVDPNRPGLRALCWCIADYQRGPPQSHVAVAKLRTKLVAQLFEAAAIPDKEAPSVLDHTDAALFLSACETAIVVKREEDKKWLHHHH